jgi:hypothetical protein
VAVIHLGVDDGARHPLLRLRRSVHPPILLPRARHSPGRAHP